MGTTQQFIKMLVADEEEIETIVDEMDEKNAKQMLKELMKALKKMK